MLRKYKDYKYVKPVRRNVNLVKDQDDNYCVLSTQPIQNKEQTWVAAKQYLYEKLHHPNIDRALDVFISQSSNLPELVVVTYMCYNTTLDGMLGSLSKLYTELALLDLAEGVRYLHEEARVIHRNIRGTSVLVHGCTFLISDFSEAELLSTGGHARGLAGKKYCMSPEMLATQPYNFSSDIWALGILFVELLIGIPFRTIENKIAALLPDFPESILLRIEEPWAKELLRGMFQKNPEKRITIREVQARLKQALKDPWEHGPCPEVKKLSEASRLLVDRDRHLFVYKKFSTLVSETEGFQISKVFTGVSHPNVVRIQEFRVKYGECYATLEYCSSGPLIALFKQLHYNEVLDVIKGLWLGFRYLSERGLLITEHLSLQHILMSEARPKLQIFTEKTFLFSGQHKLSDSDRLSRLGQLFLYLLLREYLRQYQVCEMVSNRNGFGLKERYLERILMNMLGNSEVSRTIYQIHGKLMAFFTAKREEETVIVYRNYRVLSYIAYGAFGKVYVAETSDRQQYAIKIIPTRLESDRTDAECEAANLSKTSHPNIVKLYEYFYNESKTEMVLVMECCEYHTLKEAVPNLSPEQRVHVLKELCEAVRYLHLDLRMVHRDIKPANILLMNNSVKLCDFGRSKFLKTGESITGVVGTTYYMPPYMANLEEYGFSVDIWNLGIVLLEVFLGRITANNSIAFMDSAFPENYLAEISNTCLRGLLGSMIRRRPTERPTIETILGVLNDLSNCE